MASFGAEELAERIAARLGAGRTREPAGAEADAALIVAEPATPDEIGELVRMCETDQITLAPVGAARTLAQIRRAPVAIGVSLARLARIIAYEPDDLTVAAEAGLTVGELNRAMAPSRQRLGTDPRDPDSTTVGALIGAHHCGPLRLSEGTVRDLLIGIRYVGHGGAIVRSGGRVVKNVAGYDLMKVMTGSFGTLGIVAEATFKVRPAPEHTAMALGAYARAGDALDAAEEIADLVALAHLEVLSPAVAATALERGGKFLLAAGIAGNRAELGRQREQIAEVLGGRAEFLEDGEADAAYVRLRDAMLPPAALVARIAVLPAELQRCLDACGAGDFLAHAASGVAEIASVGSLNPHSAELLLTQWREIARSARGNLRVIRAAPELRGTIDFFDTPDRAALALMRRLKTAFDPAGVFNPGCFVGGL